jgi:FHA domain
VSAFGSSRRRIGKVLNAAFAEGLLSDQTHSDRVALLYGPQLVDRQRLIGDLTLRAPTQASIPPIRRAWAAVSSRLRARVTEEPRDAPLLLALDATRGERLLIGRNPRCDVVLDDLTVSRQHAQLTFRDGAWVIQDLASKNGLAVNGKRVVRTSLRCGDVVAFGDQLVQID